MHIIKTTTRERITLPVDIRRKFGIKDGTKVRFQIDEDKKRILITPVTRKMFEREQIKIF